jgi:hypothetical protein
MPDLIRYPVIPLDSANDCAVRLEKLHCVPGLVVIPDPDPGRNDKRKEFIRRFNISRFMQNCCLDTTGRLFYGSSAWNTIQT